MLKIMTLVGYHLYILLTVQTYSRSHAFVQFTVRKAMKWKIKVTSSINFIRNLSINFIKMIISKRFPFANVFVVLIYFIN